MEDISIVAETCDRLAALRDILPDQCWANYLRLEDLPVEGACANVLLDINLGSSDNVQLAKSWLLKRPRRNGHVIVCIDDGTSYRQLTQARALGATAVLARPPSAPRLRRILLGDDRIVTAATPPVAAADPSPDLHAIENIFAAARNGYCPSIELVADAGAQIVDRLKNTKLPDYVSAIRNHHNRTYTHCLTVTAVAVAFGLQLGFGRGDTERLAVAGLLHDIGKSQIPIRILEKPSALDAEETAIMQSHPLLGYRMLRDTVSLPGDTLDMVLHHHEYLDGSGYPDGLRGSDISDLNRMITIADIFGALVEPRSYKPSMSGEQAFGVLYAMGPKLDRSLVRVFASIAHSLAAGHRQGRW